MMLTKLLSVPKAYPVQAHHADLGPLGRKLMEMTIVAFGVDSATSGRLRAPESATTSLGLRGPQ